jgi:hypothetical protein
VIYHSVIRYQVVGVDGVRKAAEDFVQENHCDITGSTKVDGMEIMDLSSKVGAGYPIRFVVGDFFHMKSDVAGTFEVFHPPAPPPPQISRGHRPFFLLISQYLALRNWPSNRLHTNSRGPVSRRSSAALRRAHGR